MKTIAGKSTVQKPIGAYSRHGTCSDATVLIDNRDGSTAVAEWMPAIEHSPPILAQRQTIQRMQTHQGATAGPGGPVVQRKISWMNAIHWMEEGSLPPALAQVNVNDCTDRDLCDTLLLIDVMKARYGTALHKLEERQLGKLLNTIIAWTSNTSLSRGLLVEKLRIMEAHFGLTAVRDETFTQTLAGKAEAREGAYTWDKGHHDFYSWISQETGVPLFANALINCWEAVLALAIEAGLVDRAEVAQTYRLLERPRATDERGSPTWYDIDIDTLFAKRQREKIRYGEGPKNAIRRDDVLVHNQAMERFHHVVIALKPAPDDYNEVEVMSLWQQNAASFARKKLGEVIRLEKGDEIMICDFSGGPKLKETRVTGTPTEVSNENDPSN